MSLDNPIRSSEELENLHSVLVERRSDDHLCISICTGTGCVVGGAESVVEAFREAVSEMELEEKIEVKPTGCHGFCEMGPLVTLTPSGYFYPHVHARDAREIIEKTLLNDEVVEKLLYHDPQTDEAIAKEADVPFYKHQKRIILAENGHLNPNDIEDYISIGGYKGLAHVLDEMDQDEVITQLIDSRLAGRGGAGFLTGKKWEICRKQPNEPKFLVCNADEGDPGAYMDRSILEGNPHRVIEGMCIGAFAIGASQGFIYVRHEYPLAVERITRAIEDARAAGMLGEDIMGSGLNFDLKVVRGAGAFVCGEESALLRSLEGLKGEPKQRPPFPVEKGFQNKPTVINNVETWANVPHIINNGPEWFAGFGTESSAGTKIFSLVGKVNNTGLVEVPMGVTIREIVFDIGGGIPDGKKFKAVQTGGPAGGCLPTSMLDLPVDFHALQQAGTIMGSGGLIVMDEDTCMVDLARYFTKFLEEESCGKCYSCRKGTQRMRELLDDICEGRGTLDHLTLLEELGPAVNTASMCGLGQNAANPVLSTLRYFRDEYERHIVDKRCDAFVCGELVAAPCQSSCPLGTEAWRYVAHIARGEYEKAYIAIRESNPFPSICARVCDHQCEQRCRLGTTGQDPIAIRALKRFVTDTVDPSIFEQERPVLSKDKKVAVVGAGPAGLTAAHLLSLDGYKVTIFDANNKPGGMLILGIPEFRLPRDVLEREIAALINDNITLSMGKVLGQDITIDRLFDDGFDAVFLALGSLKSQRLGVDGEDSEGVIPSIEFLKAFNLNGTSLARGNVGVIGGGNSAVDAARIALRQEGVHQVNIIYRRTRDEMPAFQEEIDGAIEEGVILETLLSPLKIQTENGTLTGLECIENELGDRDDSGRRRPVPVAGTERSIPLDTLIIAIGEKPDIEDVCTEGTPVIEATDWGTIKINPDTLTTNRKGLFAGGDVVTGPNTVVDAIAAGKKAAVMIDRYLSGEELRQPDESSRPSTYVEPAEAVQTTESSSRLIIPHTPVTERQNTFIEVEKVVDADSARCEARRCLRCDLEFTEPPADEVDATCVSKGDLR